MTVPARPRVLVLFGGRSSEHAISCLSAGSVLDQLDRERFDVVGVGITRDGAWVLGPSDGGSLRLRGRDLPEIAAGEAVALPAEGGRPELIRLDAARAGEVVGAVDVVIPVLHGAGGEDGTVQGLFETVGVPYVGAGVCASAASMDKDVTKRLLRAEGIEVGPWVTLRAGDTADAVDQATRERLGLPVFVKPARAGSSVGISRVTDWADLDAALALARESDPKVLVESGIVGREIECGVLEFPDGRVQASVPAEVRVTGGAGWYDFDTKYLDDACELDVPAKLDDDVAEAVRTTAVRVFRAMDCSGLARVDFFLADDGPETQRGGARPSPRLMVNELNTMPGFTATSLYPRMWATTGIDYPTLLTTLVETALARGTGLR
jgi:D-alanine-D-alanine ligase